MMVTVPIQPGLTVGHAWPSISIITASLFASIYAVRFDILPHRCTRIQAFSGVTRIGYNKEQVFLTASLKSVRRPCMHHLPTGTVTLLFTDIEGSTRLLRQLGNRYADV